CLAKDENVDQIVAYPDSDAHPSPGRSCSSRRIPDPHHSLSEVLPREQTDERLRRVLEAGQDIFADDELTGGDPGFQIGEGGGVSVPVVGVDEALYGQAFHHEETGDAARAVGGRRGVVVGDRAAADDAAMVVHAEEARFEDVAADVVEVDVDAAGG